MCCYLTKKTINYRYGAVFCEDTFIYKGENCNSTYQGVNYFPITALLKAYFIPYLCSMLHYNITIMHHFSISVVSVLFIT